MTTAEDTNGDDVAGPPAEATVVLVSEDDVAAPVGVDDDDEVNTLRIFVAIGVVGVEWWLELEEEALGCCCCCC